MKTFEYVITVPGGLDVKPAGQLNRAIREYKSDIVIQKGEKSAKLKMLLAVMQLGIRCGETVKVTVEGEDEAVAASALEEFFKANL